MKVLFHQKAVQMAMMGKLVLETWQQLATFLLLPWVQKVKWDSFSNNLLELHFS